MTEDEYQKMDNEFHEDMKKLSEKYPQFKLTVVGYCDEIKKVTVGGNGCYLCSVEFLMEFVAFHNLSHAHVTDNEVIH